MPTGKQIRAARMLVDWSADDLGAKINLSRESIQSIERGDKRPRVSTMEKIVGAFEKEGIEFLDQSGVRRRDDKVREIDGPNCYARLLDEVYYKLKPDEEFLVSMVDESLSRDEAHQAYIRIVRKGIKFRKLIKEGNTHIRGPLSWYRQIERRYYHNAAAIFFQDMCAYLTEDFQKVIIVRDPAIAQANKNFFEIIWSHGTTPERTDANEKYE